MKTLPAITPVIMCMGRPGRSQALACRFSQLATVSIGWLSAAARLTERRGPVLKSVLPLPGHRI